METKFQTSFIPKKPIIQEEKSHSKLSLLLLVSIIIFFVSLGLGGWVFLQKNILIQNIAKEKETINTNKSSFEVASIEDIVSLDSRIKIANQLLEKHVAISPIFYFLGQRTLPNVRFKSFSVSGTGKDASGQPNVTIEMSGQARDFKTVASQADEFGKAEWKSTIKEPKISGLSVNQDSSVTFTFSTIVVADSISYLKNISSDNNITQ